MFEILGSHPVLVDFDDSVLDREGVFGSGGTSLVSRSIEARPRLRRLVGLLGSGPRRGSVTSRVLARLRQGRKRIRVLVVGGATAGDEVRELYEAADIETVGFDVYHSPLTQFVADAHAMPLADATFDGVWIQAVLEHVVDPHRVVGEIHRVLRPGGVVLSVMPFMQQVHEGAYDFVRLTERGHRWLFRWFEEVESGVVAGPGTALSWSIDRFVRSLTRSRTLGRATGLAFGWLAWLEGLMAPGQVSDAASCLYFVGARAEQPLGVKALVRGYRGAQRSRNE